MWDNFFLTLLPVGFQSQNEGLMNMIVSDVYLSSCLHQPKPGVEDKETLLQQYQFLMKAEKD